MLCYRGQLQPQGIVVVVIDQVKAKARWSFCLAGFCFVLCAALVGVLCIDAYYGGEFLCTYAFFFFFCLFVVEYFYAQKHFFLCICA